MQFDLFNKYNKLEFKESEGTLFPIDLRVASKGFCPFCGNKLYEMRNRPFYFCKSVKHKNKFIISKDKVYEPNRKS